MRQHPPAGQQVEEGRAAPGPRARRPGRVLVPLRTAIAAVLALTLAACGGGAPPSPSPSASGDAPATSVPTPGGPHTATPSASVAGVPTAAELAGHLATPADLGPDWTLWEGFTAWPGGRPGVIPDDQRALIPSLPLCPRAGEEAVGLAGSLRWQAFTQVHQQTPDPFATMVVAQQLLLADHPDRTAAMFATLRDGLTRCLTANLPADEWEIGLREALQVPPVGDDRFAERSSSFDPGEARRDTRLVLLHDGPVLMAVQIDEVLIRPDAEATLTPEAFDAVVQAMAEKLP